MARVLLGVTGGIAAYKALELTRLATKAGHAVRVIQTEASTRFVGTASFAAITGAPVLITEWEADALRGAFPGDPAPEHAPLSHLALVERRGPLRDRARERQHDRQARRRPGRQPADRGRARVPATADRRSGHERCDVRARRRRARTSRRCAPAASRCWSPAPARSARRGSGASAACPSRPSCWPPSRRASAPPRAARSTACTCSSPPAARASRSTPCASSATAAPAGWAGRWPRRPPAAAPRSPSSPPTWRCRAQPGIDYVDVSTAAELAAACRERFPAADVLLMAAAVADYRPASVREDKIKKTEAGETLALELERTDDVLSGLAAERRPDQLLVGFAAEHGDQAVAYARDKLERKRLDAVVVNDVSCPGDRVRRPRQRGHDRHRGRRAARPAGHQGGGRGESSRRRVEPPFIFERKGQQLMEPVEGHRQPPSTRRGR